MKEYEKPIIEDEIIESSDIVCVSQGEATRNGATRDWSDIINEQ